MLLTAVVLALAAAPAARDPFAAFATAEPARCTVVATNAAACAAIDDLTVTGIVTGTSAPRVLVTVSGGQSVVLRVGDHLAGGRITAVRRDAVIVERVTFSNVAPASRTLLTLPLGH
jgi:hypothetical protein